MGESKDLAQENMVEGKEWHWLTPQISNKKIFEVDLGLCRPPCFLAVDAVNW